jgi:general secretion pathway protein D
MPAVPESAAGRQRAGQLPHRAKKANTSSMSRGFYLLLSLPAVLFHSTAPALRIARRNAIPAAALLFLFGIGFFASSAHAQSAAAWSKRGADAEVREDYDTAYEDYKHAHEKKPKDLRFLAHFERMRFLAAMQHIDRGRVLRQSGDYAGAIQQFMRAGQIDPSNQAAQQEIERTQRDQPPPQLTGAAAVAAHEQMSQQKATLDAIGSIAPPIQLKAISDDHQTLHMVEDVKVIYQAIGKVAGLNVLFDPDYTSKRIPVDLTNVTTAEALRIVGTISGTFYKAVTPNTIFVAQNTRTKRTDLDDLAVQTFYLSNSSQPNDGNEILTGLRLLLDPSVKLYLVPSQNAIVMRATTDELLLAEKLINDFDRARAEVVVDVAVLEVNRDKIRNLGITLPTSIGLTPELATTTSSTTTTTTSTTNTSASLTLNNLAHLNATDFGVTVSGGTVNALLSDTDTRVLQNPRIRATDGQRATLKIGQKIPVATGSYNAGVSTGVASIGVQTQFTYLDVGVNIDITPTVHYDREISLKCKVEVSQQNGSVTISGVTEPIIAQRVLEQVIQLKDNEPSILAGIVTKQDNNSVTGTPGLGELPFFKFFFSSQNKEVQQDEIVFLLIPHIVRESVLNRLNTAVIDTGTGSSIELRREEAAKVQVGADLGDPGLTRQPQTTAAQAASAALQGMHQQAQPPVPPSPGMPPGVSPNGPPLVATAVPSAAMAPSGSAFTPGVSVAVVPSNSTQTVGSTFQVAVMLSGGQDIYSVPMQIQFDPRVLQLVNVEAGDFLSKDGQPATVAHRLESNGLVTISTTRPPNAKGVTGQGNICTLTFKAATAGDSPISFARVGAKNSAQTAIPANGTQAMVHVK